MESSPVPDQPDVPSAPEPPILLASAVKATELVPKSTSDPTLIAQEGMSEFVTEFAPAALESISAAPGGDPGKVSESVLAAPKGISEFDSAAHKDVPELVPEDAPEYDYAPPKSFSESTSVAQKVSPKPAFVVPESVPEKFNFPASAVFAPEFISKLPSRQELVPELAPSPRVTHARHVSLVRGGSLPPPKFHPSSSPQAGTGRYCTTPRPVAPPSARPGIHGFSTTPNTFVSAMPGNAPWYPLGPLPC